MLTKVLIIIINFEINTLYFVLWTVAEQSELGRVEVEYINMAGWKTTIAHSKSISDLPPNAKAYVEKIWELTGIPGKQIMFLIIKLQVL